MGGLVAGIGALGGFIITFFLGVSKDSSFENGQARGIFIYTILCAIGIILIRKLE